MGACAAQCCSSDVIQQKKIEKFMMPELREQHSLSDTPSEPLHAPRITQNASNHSTSNELGLAPLFEGTPPLPALRIQRPSVIMDEKTLKLLSNLQLIGPATPTAEQIIEPAAAQSPHIEAEPYETTTPQTTIVHEEDEGPTPATPEPDDPQPLNLTNHMNEALEETGSFEFHELEKNIDSFRVKALADVVDPQELEQILRAQYNDDSHEEDEESSSSDESSLEEEEKLEIQRRKSEQSISQNSPPPMLYRDSTQSTWDDDQVTRLHKDMEQQLASLTDLNAPKYPMIGVVSEEFVDTEASMMTNFTAPQKNPSLNSVTLNSMNREVGLFRNQSAASWNEEQMSEAEQDMKKAMMHLLTERRQSVSSKTGNK